MRTKGIILLALAAVAALSCSVREDDMHVIGGTVSFKATLADVPFTKTVLQNDGSVYWSPGDAINLFYGATGSARLDAENTEPAAQVNFTGTLEGFVPDGSSYFWAVYPYSADNSFDGSAVTLTLPDVQTAVAGTFADDLFVTMAHSQDYTLQFYNVCGGVKFSVAGEGIKYVTFKGNSDEILAGKVKVGLDEEGKPQVKEVVDGKKEIRVDAPGGGTFETGKWYYIVAFPDTLASGYTMSFYDDKLIAERVENKTVTLKRSIWGKLTEADDVAITATKWLTFTSEGTTTISLLNQGDNAPVLYYSTDHTNWTQWDYSELTFTSSAPLYLCGDNPGGFSFSVTKYSKFDGSGSKYSVSGDIMSLLNKDDVIKVIPNKNCFRKLFEQSTILKTAPKLEATTLTYNCYELMFSGCTGLTAAPDLPATTLADYCYAGMFRECINLTAAPDLPATTLANGCYMSMFYYCINLTAAPNLPATTLADYCYNDLFKGCVKLNYVKCLATNIDAKYCTSDWLGNVSSSGTFVKAPEMDKWTLGIPSGIPSGWTVYEDITASNYLTFTSEGTTTISLLNQGDNAPVLYYSTDHTNWTQWDYSELTFTSSAPLYLCGDNPDGFSFSVTKYSKFVADGSNYCVSGDIMSLLNKDDVIKVIPNKNCFRKLFEQSPILKTAPKLEATTLTYNCYELMFSGCTGLTAAPDLPATTLAEYCYAGMFRDCTGLTAAPDLPATTLANGCYMSMFYYCTNLTAAPNLPATTLADYCYNNLFKGCEKLNYVKCLATNIDAKYCTSDWLGNVSSSGTFVKAPEMDKWTLDIPSGIPYRWTVKDNITASNYLTFTSQGTTTLKLNDYGGNNPKLYYSTDKTDWTEWNHNDISFTDGNPLYICGDNASGFSFTSLKYSTFSAEGDRFEVYGDVMSLIDKDKEFLDEIPCDACFTRLFYDCTTLQRAPELPATKLKPSCYNSMFYNCTHITQAPELDATTLASSCYSFMFAGCSSLNYVRCLATDISADNCVDNWLGSVFSEGVFFKASEMTDWSSGESGIPAGWTIMDVGD